MGGGRTGGNGNTEEDIKTKEKVGLETVVQFSASVWSMFVRLGTAVGFERHSHSGLKCGLYVCEA